MILAVKGFKMMMGVLVAGMAAGCALEQNELVPQDSVKTRTVKVVAEMPGNPTKTTMVGSMEDGFTFEWSKGDQLQIFEILDLYAFNNMASTELEVKPLAAGGAKAEFEVTIPVRENPDNKDFNYVAVYPPSPQNYACFTDEYYMDQYLEWYQRLGYQPADFKPHFNLMTEIPTTQYPTAGMFDPKADLMVSQMVVSDKMVEGKHVQVDKLAMKFARVGAVLRLNLKGIPEGAKILNGQWKVGPSYCPAYVREYDPIVQATALFEKSAGFIGFSPVEVRAASVNGVVEAPIWLRCACGSLSDEFEVQVYTGEDQDDPNLNYYTKKVSLAGKSPIVFKDGGMTSFNVTVEETPFPSSVGNLQKSDITTSTAKVSARVYLGKRAEVKSVYFVWQKTDGGYNVEQMLAEGTKVDAVLNETDMSFTADLTGLVPDATHYVCAVAEMKHGERAISSVIWFNTDKNEAVPQMVDMGFPSGTKWAAWNLGATKPEEFGDYYSWGALKYDPTAYWSDYRFATKETNPALEYTTDGYCLSKYSSNIELGCVDQLSTLELADDAAHVRLGGDWRLPTESELFELWDNAVPKFVQMNGVNGVEFTSIHNGNKIFFPYAGCTEGYEYNTEKNKSAWIWSASPCEIGYDRSFVASSTGMKMYSESGSVEIRKISRCMPISIRPVSGPYKAISDRRVVYTNELSDDLKLSAKIYPAYCRQEPPVTDESRVYLLIEHVEKENGAYPRFELVENYYSLPWSSLTDNTFNVDIKQQFSKLPKGKYYYRVMFHHSTSDDFYGETRMFEIK